MTVLAKPRALVVDDERQMLSIVTFALETQGFNCDSTSDPIRAWDFLQTQTYQLIVADILMPGMSGVELTRKIRGISNHTPIILLTALGEEEQRITGLEAGADDYVTKPFSPRELALRAQAIVRRSRPHDTLGQLSLGDLHLDQLRGVASWKGLPLTESLTEVRLLALLADNAGKTVPARTLIAEVWKTANLRGGREMLKTTVYRLRKKMELVGTDCRIESRRGIGYSLQLPQALPKPAAESEKDG